MFTPVLPFAPAATPKPTRRRPRRGLALGALLLAGLAAATSARPEAALHCGAQPRPDEVLQRLNEARARGAVCNRAGTRTVASPLQWNANLAAVAEAQSQDMAELDQMSHHDAHDRALPERLALMGYRFSAAAENVAVGYASLEAVVDAWLRSESHCDNLMNAKVQELGMACVDARSASPVGEGRYWTLVLGVQRRNR